MVQENICVSMRRKNTTEIINDFLQYWGRIEDLLWEKSKIEKIEKSKIKDHNSRGINILSILIIEILQLRDSLTAFLNM